MKPSQRWYFLEISKYHFKHRRLTFTAVLLLLSAFVVMPILSSCSNCGVVDAGDGYSDYSDADIECLQERNAMLKPFENLFLSVIGIAILAILLLLILGVIFWLLSSIGGVFMKPRIIKKYHLEDPIARLKARGNWVHFGPASNSTGWEMRAVCREHFVEAGSRHLSWLESNEGRKANDSSKFRMRQELEKEEKKAKWVIGHGTVDAWEFKLEAGDFPNRCEHCTAITSTS